MGGGRRRRTVTPEEAALWQAVMQDVAPLRRPGQPAPTTLAPVPPAPATAGGRPVPIAEETAAPVPPARQPAGRSRRGDDPSAGSRQRPLFVEPSGPGRRRPDPLPGLDRRTADRFRRGDMAIDATLDLHGLTQAQAQAVLGDFLHRCWCNRCRAVLVITGKGSRSGTGRPPGGVLQDRVPHWLAMEPNRAIVLSVTRAQPKHGGAGALYVLLKRARPAVDAGGH